MPAVDGGGVRPTAMVVPGGSGEGEQVLTTQRVRSDDWGFGIGDLGE